MPHQRHALPHQRHTIPNMHRLTLSVTDNNLRFLTYLSTTFGVSVAEVTRRILIDTEQLYRQRGVAGLNDE